MLRLSYFLFLFLYIILVIVLNVWSLLYAVGKCKEQEQWFKVWYIWMGDSCCWACCMDRNGQVQCATTSTKMSKNHRHLLLLKEDATWLTCVVSALLYMFNNCHVMFIWYVAKFWLFFSTLHKSILLCEIPTTLFATSFGFWTIILYYLLIRVLSFSFMAYL